MPLIKKFGRLALLLATVTPVFGSEHAISPRPDIVLHLGPMPVTNSMIATWVIAILLIIAIRLAVRKPRLVPTRSQAIVESLVTGVMDLITPIVGPKATRASFPLLVGLFTYILIQNWSGMIPGFGTLKILQHGQWVDLIRPGDADMNSTFALAVVSMIVWFYIVLRYAGVKAILYDIFGNKADKNDVPVVLYYFLSLIFVGVGFIEIISIGLRLISLSCRLFGNMLGGENLMHSMYGIEKWLLPTPFYFLEILTGFVQALIFTLLVAVYIGLICNHEGGDHAAHEPESAPAAH